MLSFSVDDGEEDDAADSGFGCKSSLLRNLKRLSSRKPPPVESSLESSTDTVFAASGSDSLTEVDIGLMLAIFLFFESGEIDLPVPSRLKHD